MRCDVAGSIVDMSTQSFPGEAPSRTPPLPRYTISTCDDDGSIVTMRSAPRAASPAEPAAFAPAFTASSSAAGATSYAVTAKPFVTRLASMGRPMVPVPMNAIVMMEILPAALS